MKKLLVIILALISLSSYAQKDTTDLKAAINANFPDNTSGFITPLKLRTVALDLMRSNANLMEYAQFTGKVLVPDSVKSETGFYVWNGSIWERVGDPADSAVWARSGGFILPLDYSDKLTIDTARVGGNLYPNSGTVNIGRSSAPFDTVFANSLIGVAGINNTLDEAYDQGRTITADAGAVEITGGLLVSDTLGIGTSTPTKTLDVEGTALIHNSDNSSMLFRGLIADTLLGVLPLSAYGAGAVDTTGDWMSFNYAGADNLANEQGVHNLLIRKSTGDFRLLKVLEDRIQLGVGNILTYPDPDGDVELQVAQHNNNAEWRFRDKTSHWAVKDSLGVDIVTIGETNGLTYVDGNQALGKALVSDADGNASWASITPPSKHIAILPANLGKGATAPTEIIVGNFTGWEFTINDDAVFTVPSAHDMDASHDVALHITWVVNEAYATNSGEVQWQMNWSALDYSAVESVTAPTHSGTVATGDINIPATANTAIHTTSLIIPAASISALDVFGFTLKRIALVGGSNPTADPTIIDVHLEYIPLTTY